MPLTVLRDNIINLNTDAIVLPANRQLKEGPGTSTAIFEAAGREALTKACAEIGSCELGRAVMTDGFGLPARHIIHTVNPLYFDGKHHEEELLYQSYISALDLAKASGLKSIAFPLLSAGSYGYPKGSALEIANRAIGDFMALGEAESDMDIRLVLFNRDTLQQEARNYRRVTDHISRRFAKREHNLNECQDSYEADASIGRGSMPSCTEAEAEVLSRIDRSRIDKSRIDRSRIDRSRFDTMALPDCIEPDEELTEALEKSQISEDFTAKKEFVKKEDAQPIGSTNKFSKNPDFPRLIKEKKTFLEMLMKYMIESEMTNAQIYSRANINRKTFSKIINGQVIPKKETILALAISLRLSLKQTEDLLARAGHAFIEADLSDTIVKYFIQHREYDIFLINEFLYDYGLKLLGNVAA